MEQLHADRREAKAELREVLERLAERHGISQKDINYAIDGYADDMLSDLIYSVERELEHESRLMLEPRARGKLSKQCNESIESPPSPKSQRDAQERHTVVLFGFDQFVAVTAKAERAAAGRA